MRVKGGVITRARHKKVLKRTKGFWMSRGKQIKKAKEALLHQGEYAYHGRKRKKRDFRALWIIRINAALSKNGIKYNLFIKKMKDKKIELDRKVLSQIAAQHPQIFKQIVNEVKK